MKPNNYQISRMNLEELKVTIDWMRQEGWNPGLNDAECFYNADPNGFFVGKLNGEIIAVASAVIYDSQFAFCGCYIVKPGYRKQNYGFPLTQARLNYIGHRTVGLDGVVDMIHKYANIGYEPSHNNIRYALDELPTQFQVESCVSTIDESTLEKVMMYDRNYFPAPRKNFLSCWLAAKNGKALVYILDEVVQGYGVIRQCFSGYKIGPLFAETAEVAEALFLQLIKGCEETPIFLDIPKPNLQALQLVNKYKMKQKFETIRMYRNGIPPLNLDNIYGITTFELG